MLNSLAHKACLSRPHIIFHWNKAAAFALPRKAEGSVSKFEDHRRRAAECLRLAREAVDKTNKALLIEMARTWAKLAEQNKIAEQERTKIGKEQR
jgi:hypothetical protein